MAIKEFKFNKSEFIEQFKGALDQLKEAERLGKEYVGERINRILFVGCGAQIGRASCRERV